jgi:hypothetical protein
VRLDGPVVLVHVREGQVEMDADGTKWTSGAGEAVRLTANLDPERDSIAANDPKWSWVAELPRPFTLEGSTLRAFLDWVSRELGWKWRYEDQSMRAHFDSVVQVGSIEGLPATDALETVLRANELSYRLTEGPLVIVPRR